MYASVSVAIYVPFGSIYHNLSGLGPCVCNASCIGGSKTVYTSYLTIRNVFNYSVTISFKISTVIPFTYSDCH